MNSPSSASRSAVVLGALLASAGSIHFLRPQTFDGIVPSWVPGTARQMVHLSGLAELACSALVLAPRTRRLGGWSTAALFVLVFPANVDMAMKGGAPGGTPTRVSRVFGWARLPLQAPLVVWAYRVAQAPR